jgi:serine/threonine-protein kinase
MILSNQFAGDADVKRFYREARAAGSLRHPHIVGIHEVGQYNGQHYFAMDFISGSSLASLTRSGPIEPEEAARCLARVARAVQYLHDHGIVHRDLKPSNILLDEARHPYVTDFGLAKVFGDQDERTQTGTTLGTPGYMPPEQAAGKVNEISCCSDVYSLGAILYEMLTGRPPFREESPHLTILQVIHSEPTLPRHLNPRVRPELERICLKCLEKSPDRRYPSATALANDLERYLRREPLEARAAGFKDHFRRWLRRESGLAARLVIMMAALGLIEAEHLISRRPPTYHLSIKIAFVVWALLAVVFQWFLRRPKTANFARIAWAITDPLLLLFVLSQAEEIGPILVGYPVIIAAAGLWFSVRLVAMSTAACVLSYAWLLAIRHEPTEQPHYPLIFIMAMVVIGAIVGYQVHRVQALSRYFDQAQPLEPKKSGN